MKFSLHPFYKVVKIYSSMKSFEQQVPF